MKILGSLLILSVVAAVPANATNWYLDLFAGVGTTEDTSFGVLDGSSIETKFDNMSTYGLSFGYKFKNRLRLEGEVTRREADVESHNLDNGGPIDGSFGEANSTLVFANLFYDLDNSSKVTPYLGVGVGNVGVDYANFGVPGLPALDDDDDVIGYQFAAGLAVAMSDSWDFRVDLRVLEAEDAELTSSVDTSSVSSDVSYSAYDLTLGVRYRFGAN